MAKASNVSTQRAASGGVPRPEERMGVCPASGQNKLYSASLLWGRLGASALPNGLIP